MICYLFVWSARRQEWFKIGSGFRSQWNHFRGIQWFHGGCTAIAKIPHPESIDLALREMSREAIGGRPM